MFLVYACRKEAFAFHPALRQMLIIDEIMWFLLKAFNRQILCTDATIEMKLSCFRYERVTVYKYTIKIPRSRVVCSILVKR